MKPLRLQVDVFHHFPAGADGIGPVLSSVEFLMSKLSDAIAAANTAADAAIQRSNDTVAAAKKTLQEAQDAAKADHAAEEAKVAELQAKVDAGLGSDADVAALGELKSKLDNFGAAVNTDETPASS